MSKLLLTSDAVPLLLRCVSARLMRDDDAPLDDHSALKRLNAMIDAKHGDHAEGDDLMEYHAFLEEYQDAMNAFIESMSTLLSVVMRGAQQDWWCYRYRFLNPYGDVAVEHALRQRHGLDVPSPIRRDPEPCLSPSGELDETSPTTYVLRSPS